MNPLPRSVVMAVVAVNSGVGNVCILAGRERGL